MFGRGNGGQDVNTHENLNGVRRLSRENELAILDWIRRHGRFA